MASEQKSEPSSPSQQRQAHRERLHPQKRFPPGCLSLRVLRASLRLGLSLFSNAVSERLRAFRWRRGQGSWQQQIEPIEIQRLQKRAAECASDITDHLPASSVDATGITEILAEILDFTSVQVVGRCTAVSRGFLQGATRDDLWCELCYRRWQGKQHSVHMRRWISAPRCQPIEAEDLMTCYASEAQMIKASQASEVPWPSEPRRCRVASWKDRYVFAERDAHRTAISLEELCWDCSSTAGSSSGPYAARTRRWHVLINFITPFEVEAFFFEDGRFKDTHKFSQMSVPWHFSYEPTGEVCVRIMLESTPVGPVLLHVDRNTEDWGWRMTPVGTYADRVLFRSRQLSTREHDAALRVPHSLQTLYLRRMRVGSSARGFSPEPAYGRGHVYGSWQCVRAYQGMLCTATWAGVEFVMDQGTLTVTHKQDAADGGAQESYDCHVDEQKGTLDVILSDGSEQLGIFSLEIDGEVLVACRRIVPGMARPAMVPAELPTAEEVLRDLQDLTE
mmetsp:Transcript_55823/g.103306  ORF Transcript_55823/g.103306 Transcript_55823/m.103306 type:complete len:505 (-) Transcript_55823:127-1641(-)